MPTSRRVRSAVLSASLTFVGALALGWLWLYLDSLHERERAELLIADLKSFPFATARFVEVRELANRYGGTAVQSFRVLQFLPPGPPLIKFPGSTDPQERMPLVRTRPICTPQDCIFDIWIRPRLFNLPLNYETSWFLYSGLAHVGLRPWVVGGRFEVRDGKLWESRTGVGQFRHARIRSYEGLILLGYQVISMSRAKALDDRIRQEYAVGVPHVTGTISDDLSTWIVQAPNAPINRAFDVRLHCLTAVSHTCRGFADLAPSAWGDYQAGKSAQLK
jgi:hypothetical protein